MGEEIIREYLRAVEREYRSGIAGEHSYRPALKALVEALGGSGVQAINEPARVACGAPDFVVQRKNLPIGHIEAKDIGVDLDKEEKGEQVRRYREALGNLILTDYLEFRFYVDGELKNTATLATVAPRSRLVEVAAGAEHFLGFMRSFLEAKPLPIGRPRQLAIRLAAVAVLVREVIEKALAVDKHNGERASSTLHELLKGFQKVLLPDLSEADFADMYAQTVVYGLFAARDNHVSPSTFTRESVAFDIPKTNPFLRKLFNYVAGPDLDKRLEWIILDLIEFLRAADMGAIKREFAMRKPGEDPVVHFYETFLKEYDPKRRELRGVYYTPQPVVGYIVRSVDALLKRDFGLKRGLADHSKLRWKPPQGNGEQREFHRVQILDPALGTGSFLFRVVELIHATFKGNQGEWPSYVSEHLLPRLHGFELMMAPYTIAHMKLGMQLRDTGYDLSESERLGIYLTNSLDNPTAQPPPELFASWLRDEALEAIDVKSKTPILVVLGNPPYSGHSANKGAWIISLLKRGDSGGFDSGRSYYYVDGKPLGERNPKWLQDDYVKFIRWAQWRIEQTGQGVLAMITNHGYLDNPTFRGMRESLMRTFDTIYVLDLHGNDRKKERVPDDVQKAQEIGPKDENVFDIQQGVAICLMVKLPVGATDRSPAVMAGQERGDLSVAPTKHAHVFHADLWGLRERKYALLDLHDVTGTEWRELDPSSAAYLFVPQDNELRVEYEQGCEVTSAFLEHSVGVATARDRLCIQWSEREMYSIVSRFASMDEEPAREAFKLGSDVRDWKVHLAQEDVRATQTSKSCIVPVLYRPFDARFTYYTGKTRGFHCMPRPKLMRHMLKGGNLALITSRLTKGEQFAHVQITENISEVICMSPKTSNNGFLFPLYLYPFEREDPRTEAPGGRRPNLSEVFIADFAKRLKLKFIINGTGDLADTFGPEDVFHYMYAVFHSPTYRTRYSEFLKRDFPRLPLTGSKKLLRELCSLGHTLTRLHLMDASAVDSARFPLPRYPVSPTSATPGRDITGHLDLNLHGGGGGDTVEKVRYTPPETGSAGVPARVEGGQGRPPSEGGRVWINKHQYFEGVPPEVWEFHIGGYQPCEKWLKDRKGRTLSYDDKEHYKLIVAILAQTRALMAEIDAVVDKNGGWPLK